MGTIIASTAIIIDKHLIRWRMAGSRTVQVGFCEVTARPISKLRRFVHDWWPYAQAQKPGFEMIVTPLVGCGNDQRFLYTLQYSNENRHLPDEIKASLLLPGKRRQYRLHSMPLIVTGDTYLVVADYYELRNNAPYYQTIYAFNTTSKTTLLIASLSLLVAVIGIVAGIAVGVINAISSS